LICPLDGGAYAITDGRGNVTALSSWKRGIPQLITYPTFKTTAATVHEEAWDTHYSPKSRLPSK
jgi:hypothetical protein